VKRRSLALGAVSVGALAAGAGFALWRSRRGEIDPGEHVDLWTSSFATPDGALLAMSSLRGKPLLLNFWATWCAPCVIEMPLLDVFAQAQTGWNVLALAIDSAEPVRQFTSKRGLRLRVALAREAGPDLAHQLGNVAGGLPFSVAFDADGQPVQRKLGALDEKLLRKWASSIH
jgi:thiol-disulfide isomerase/thioredoxin